MVEGVIIAEIVGGAIGLFLAYWFIFKPMFEKNKKTIVFECSSCKKRFKSKEKCKEHEKTCK